MKSHDVITNGIGDRVIEAARLGMTQYNENIQWFHRRT